MAGSVSSGLVASRQRHELDSEVGAEVVGGCPDRVAVEVDDGSVVPVEQHLVGGVIAVEERRRVRTSREPLGELPGERAQDAVAVRQEAAELLDARRQLPRPRQGGTLRERRLRVDARQQPARGLWRDAAGPVGVHEGRQQREARGADAGGQGWSSAFSERVGDGC